MAASSLSPTWLATTASLMFIASIGGVLVFWGLWVEGPPDDAGPGDSEAVTRNKRKARRGWKILVAGILVEIVVAAVFAAREAWQARQTSIEISKNDPLNQPVSDVSASVVFHVRQPDVAEVRQVSVNNLQAGFMTFLVSDRTNSNSHVLANFNEFEQLECDREDMRFSQGFSSADARRFLMFEMKFRLRPIFGESDAQPDPPVRVSDIVKYVDGLEIAATGVKNSVEVTGGHVELRINEVRKKFIILPQKPYAAQETNGWFNNCLLMIATNSVLQEP
jgi:hypothetical protein